MPRPQALVTQADVSRIIRAMLAEGLTVRSIAARPDGVYIETADAPVTPSATVIERKKIVL